MPLPPHGDATGPLEPGQAAGNAAKARNSGVGAWLLGVGGAIAGGAALVLSGSGGANGLVQPQATTTTTTSGTGP